MQAFKEWALDAHKARLQSFSKSSTPWEIPALAHTLFRLQRFGVPAPRLLAIGCAGNCVFVLSTVLATVPLPEAFAKASIPARTQILQQAGRIIRQLHEAGYCLHPCDAWERLLGVTPSGGTVLAQVEPLLRGKTRWQELAPLEFNRQPIRLSRAEQLRFLQSYLKSGRGPRMPVFLSGSTARERRTVA